MTDHGYALIAGIVFLLVAIAHLLRMALGTPVVVQDISFPMWASAIALVVTAFLSYEGFPSREEHRNGELVRPVGRDFARFGPEWVLLFYARRIDICRDAD